LRNSATWGNSGRRLKRLDRNALVRLGVRAKPTAPSSGWSSSELALTSPSVATSMVEVAADDSRRLRLAAPRPSTTSRRWLQSRRRALVRNMASATTSLEPFPWSHLSSSPDICEEGGTRFSCIDRPGTRRRGECSPGIRYGGRRLGDGRRTRQ